jgi:hypothetical protein
LDNAHTVNASLALNSRPLRPCNIHSLLGCLGDNWDEKIHRIVLTQWRLLKIDRNGQIWRRRTFLRLTQERGIPVGVSKAGSRRSPRSVASLSRPPSYSGKIVALRVSSTCVDNSPPAQSHSETYSMSGLLQTPMLTLKPKLNHSESLSVCTAGIKPYAATLACTCILQPMIGIGICCYVQGEI